MLIPNQVNNYSIWLGGNRFIGMADVTLPHLANLNDVKGADWRRILCPLLRITVIGRQHFPRDYQRVRLMRQMGLGRGPRWNAIRPGLHKPRSSMALRRGLHPRGFGG
jgi:hypothetical protein